MIFRDIILNCGKNNVGGIKMIYIIDFDESKLPYQKIGDEIIANGSLLDIGFSKYVTLPELSSYNTTSTRGDNKLMYFTTNVTINFPTMDKNVYNELANHVNDDMILVIEMNSGEKYFLGWDNPVHMNSLTSNAGTSIQDGKTVAATFSVMEENIPMIVKFAQ